VPLEDDDGNPLRGAALVLVVVRCLLDGRTPELRALLALGLTGPDGAKAGSLAFRVRAGDAE